MEGDGRGLFGQQSLIERNCHSWFHGGIVPVLGVGRGGRLSGFCGFCTVRARLQGCLPLAVTCTKALCDARLGKVTQPSGTVQCHLARLERTHTSGGPSDAGQDQRASCSRGVTP